LIYPNPVSCQLNIKLNFLPDNVTLLLFNQLGEKIKEVKNISKDLIVIPRDQLPPGLYYYSITDNREINIRGKIIFD